MYLALALFLATYVLLLIFGKYRAYIAAASALLFVVLGILGGAVVFFCLFSAPLRPVWEFWADTLSALAALLSLPLRWAKIFCKKAPKGRMRQPVPLARDKVSSGIYGGAAVRQRRAYRVLNA